MNDTTSVDSDDSPLGTTDETQPATGAVPQASMDVEPELVPGGIDPIMRKSRSGIDELNDE